MRRLLGVLRSDDGRAIRPRRSPASTTSPGSSRDARAAGVAVTFDLAARRRVPPAVGLAAYRIVQEALTNAAGTPPAHRCASTRRRRRAPG